MGMLTKPMCGFGQRIGGGTTLASIPSWGGVPPWVGLLRLRRPDIFGRFLYSMLDHFKYKNLHSSQANTISNLLILGINF